VKLIRRILTGVSVSGLVILMVAPASAGGSIARVSPRSWARQGAEIRLSGTFCDGAQAPVSAGPWFAYLDPQSAPPVLMGRVHIAPNTGDYCQWRLTATLTVPQVAPGGYWLQVCDRGCTEGVGDLMGAGRFTVVSAASPISQARRMQDLRTRLEASRQEETRQERLLEEVDGELTSAEAEIVSLDRQVDALRRALAKERNEPSAWFGALLVAAALSAVGIAVVIRRRRPRIVVPDTPAELMDELQRHG
jgi:hypothetical protein